MKKMIFALAAVALSLSLSLSLAACASAKKAESGAKDTSKTGAAGVSYLTLNKKFFKTRVKQLWKTSLLTKS